MVFPPTAPLATVPRDEIAEEVPIVRPPAGPRASLHTWLVPGSALLLSVLSTASCASGPPPDVDEGGPPLVQPGAPGEPTRAVGAGELATAERPTHSEADVRFMQGMIVHHAQALEMTSLLADRTSSEELRRLALRIEISQKDEIGLMERWLRARGEPVPDHSPPVAHRGRDLMPGMLTPDQMARLTRARDEAFDRLFLELMIQHHRGAITMVRNLLSRSGAAQEPETFQFAADVDADQLMEIRRMRRMLEERSP